MNYDFEHHNSWPDGCVLSGCSYVHVGEGTTGTITDTNYAEIGQNNANIAVSDAEYLTMGDNNARISISNASYIIIGNDNTNITIGSHSQDSGLSGTGANSVVVTRDVYGTEITGRSTQIHKTKYTSVDGYFNSVDFSKNILINNANGNKLTRSTVVNMENTNNNSVESAYMELKNKSPFYEYNLVNRVITVESMVPPIVRQSDNTGIILDTSLNTLINKSDGKAETQYTKVNGQWAEIIKK